MCIPCVSDSIFWCASLGMKQSAPFIQAVSALIVSPVQYSRNYAQALGCRKASAGSRS